MTSAAISTDSEGQFFEFTIVEPVLQNEWNVSFTDIKISIQSVTVSGMLTLLDLQSAPSPRAVLAMYPVGTLPKTTTNSQGKTIPATYTSLALVDIDSDFTIIDIQDIRDIIRRDYVPVADWLTYPFDQDLTNLYEQVLDYATLWMAPPSALGQEYVGLEKYQVDVEV